jgi:hypothetical protein
MMGVRRLLAATGAAVLLLGVGVSFGSVQAQKPARVTVCHNGDDGIELIRVADRAVPALLANGGGLPGGSAGEGFVYGEDCSLVPVAVAGPLEQWCDDEGGTFSTGFSVVSYLARCELTGVAPEDVNAKTSAYSAICLQQPGAFGTGSTGNSDGDLAVLCDGSEPLS